MATHHQPDEVIATYQIFPSDEMIKPAEFSTSNEGRIPTGPTISSSSTIPEPTTPHSSILPRPTWSFAGILPPDADTQKTLITIYKVHKETTKAKGHTHVAHVVLGTWNAEFLCKYDEPAGMLHNAKVIDMNETMEKATGWCRQDVKKRLTSEERVEEKRADVKYGVFKKPWSATVGLCTLKPTDDAGWHFLELRTRGIVVGGEKGGKDGEKMMVLVSSIAKRVVGGTQRMLLSVAELERLRQDDARDEERDEDEDQTLRKRKRDD